MPDGNHFELRQRLLDALDVLEHTAPPSFEAAFDLLATYLPRVPPARDAHLAERFRRVIALIRASKDQARLPANLASRRTAWRVISQERVRHAIPERRPSQASHATRPHARGAKL